MASKYAVFNTDGTLALRLIKGLFEIPSNAVPVDESLWKQLIEETDGIWKLNANGTITKHPLPTVEPDYAVEERQWRNTEINRVKWIRERHRDEVELATTTSITDEQFTELLTYVKKLRDWPEDKNFPLQTSRPTAPSWIDGQTG